MSKCIFQKLALDKLAGRVHTMFDKFYDASLLSVKPSQAMEAGKRETTMFSNFDGISLTITFIKINVLT
jgi:hypothetical protein